MDVRLIQKADPIPADGEGYALNIESLRRDTFGLDGLFPPEAKAELVREWENYKAAPNTGYVLNTAYTQSIGGPDGTGPHFEMGGYGTGPDDRGVRFYFDWVRDNVGRYIYPVHVRETIDQTRPSAGGER